MADVTIRSEMVIKLTQEEFKLVCLGLSGRLKGKHAREALKLNLRLLEQHETYLDGLKQVATGALQTARSELDDRLAELERTQGGE